MTAIPLPMYMGRHQLPTAFVTPSHTDFRYKYVTIGGPPRCPPAINRRVIWSFRFHDGILAHQ